VSVAAIAFDLDGTLIDTAPDIATALNTALAAAGLPPTDVALVRTWVGDGPDMLIRRALQHLGILDPAAGLIATLRRGFDEATLAAPLAEGRVFAGIAELLADWHGRWPMAVVTNKPTRLSRSVLDAAGLLRYVDSVHGADTLAQRKPAPALLLDAADALRVAPAQLLMVGDSATDLRTAEAAGCPAAWVAWGYGAPAADAAATVLRIENTSQLAAAVERRTAIPEEERSCPPVAGPR
jgi:phosphoglycolate phosphatase